MSEQRIEQRFVNTAPDGGVYVFPPGARSDGKPSTKEHKLAFNPDGSIYFFPPEAGTGTPPPQAADAKEIPFPGFGPHPLVRLEPGQPYFVRIPYASSLMAVQVAGTQEDTVTDLELTGSPTPGDRNWWSTPEAAFTGGRGGATSQPARWQGSAHGGGGRLGWSPSGSASDFKRPNDGRAWSVNFVSEKGGSVEFYVMGG